MKYRELKDKTTAQLSAELHVVQKQVREVYFNLASGRVKNVKEAAALRRKIAQLNTALTERKREIQK
jgi:ribosomal protein L29